MENGSKMSSLRQKLREPMKLHYYLFIIMYRANEIAPTLILASAIGKQGNKTNKPRELVFSYRDPQSIFHHRMELPDCT